MFAVHGVHVPGKSFAGDHEILVERVLGPIGSSFGMYVASGWRVDLDFCECPVFAQDGKGVVEVGVERLLGHVSEVVNHEVGSEEGVAAGTVALRSAGEIETSFGEELVLEI